MTRRPWIGITTYHRGRSGFVKLPGEYADAVRRSGGLPVLLQPGEEHIDDLLDGLDGVMLSGGGDVAPALYEDATSASPDAAVYGVDSERDDFEVRLVRAALAREVPTLCICRGVQLLNTALGGTLIAHVPDQVAGAISHRSKEGDPIPHEVKIDASSRLADVLSGTRATGCSWHHQAVAGLGEGLRPVAWASDGVVEAVESENHPDLLAVQWHPELSAADDPQQQALFDWLVDGTRSAG